MNIEIAKAKFWSRVEIPTHAHWRNHCWLWTGAQTTDNPNSGTGAGGGYGALRAEGRWWRAHRYIWTLYFGPIPDDAPLLHQCSQHRPGEDNRLCVNIFKHLEIGTLSENMKHVHERGFATGRQCGGNTQDVPF